MKTLCSQDASVLNAGRFLLGRKYLHSEAEEDFTMEFLELFTTTFLVLLTSADYGVNAKCTNISETANWQRLASCMH